MLRQFGYLKAILLGLLIGMYAGPVLADGRNETWVEVSATGTATGKPDTAMLSLTVLRTAATAREALDKNNQAMGKVLAGLTKAGIAEGDIQTSGFSMQPKYTHPRPDKNGQRPPPILTGYAVSNQLSVRVRKIDQVGTILDQAVSLGVNRISNIRFMVADPEGLREQAREAAVKKAKKKALTLTRTSGVVLDRVLQIKEHASPPRPRLMRSATAMMESTGSVPLAGGEISYSVNVQMRWVIGNKRG